MKSIIRLLKAWKNGDTSWPEGQLLQLEKAEAEKMVTAGIAEIYEPKAADCLAVSPVEGHADSGLTKEDVKNILNEVLKQNSQFNQSAGTSQEDEYMKTGGFQSISHFATEVYKSTVQRVSTETLSKWNNFMKQYESKAPSGMSEGVASDGGFAVPTEFRNTLMRNAVDASILLERTTRIPMATNSIELPTIIESSRASSIYGGIIVYRPAEGGSITGSKPKFGKIRLQLSKLAAMAYVTTELLEDSPISMEPLLSQMFSEAIGFQIDEDIVNGSGVGQALGIMNAPCLVSVPKETGQTAATIVTNNILKMWARMMSRSQGSAIWIANMDTFPQLATLALEVGTGGAPAGLLQTVTNGLTGNAIQTLLGRPLFLTEHCQTLGTTGDIICIDPRQYLVGEKSGGSIRAATSIHLKFDTDEVAFRFIVRMDGQPWMSSALTPKHGSNTLSSFVALATRS